MNRKYIIPVCNICYMAHGPLILAGSTGIGNSQKNEQDVITGDPHEAKGNTFIDEDEDESSPTNYNLWK